MLKSQLILNRFCSNFRFYISGPILTKYIIIYTKSQLIPQLQIAKSQQISTTLNAFISANSQPIWVKLWILHLMTNPNKVYDTTPNLNHFKSQPIQILLSQKVLKRFGSKFGFYISWPIITKYRIPHQISTNSQLQISKSQIIQMLISLSIFHRFGLNFGFYISWPILAKYMIPHQISNTLNLN